ncbi:MAG TPA: hypothetical protein VL916_04205 [Ilumatobacteraceae bacterium]|nr:hypothetical protein [Ilumatobacteraceae bacterium]
MTLGDDRLRPVEEERLHHCGVDVGQQVVWPHDDAGRELAHLASGAITEAHLEHGTCRDAVGARRALRHEDVGRGANLRRCASDAGCLVGGTDLARESLRLVVEDLAVDVVEKPVDLELAAVARPRAEDLRRRDGPWLDVELIVDEVGPTPHEAAGIVEQRLAGDDVDERLLVRLEVRPSRRRGVADEEVDVVGRQPTVENRLAGRRHVLQTTSAVQLGLRRLAR